nr:hypothetical protein [Xanthomonas arboricola pv. corylina]
PNIWPTPISSTPDSKPGRYSGRGDVGAAGEKKLNAEKYLLDISAYAGLPGVVEKPSIAKIADALGDIKRHMGTLAQNADARIRIVDATSIEEHIRKVVPVRQPLSDEEQS